MGWLSPLVCKVLISIVAIGPVLGFVPSAFPSKAFLSSRHGHVLPVNIVPMKHALNPKPRASGLLRMSSDELELQKIRREPSTELVNARNMEVVVGELKELEENMLASLRRRRRLMKRLGLWEQQEGNEEQGEPQYCEEYNMPHALRRLKIWSGGEAKFVDEGRVLHVRKRVKTTSDDGTVSEHEGEIFVFAYGVLVCWGCPEFLLQELLDVSQFFSRGVYDQPEEDDFTYTYGKYFSYESSQDRLVLETRNDGSPQAETRSLLEKLAASHGFAQSSKLSSFAESVQSSIIATRDLAAELAREGDIKSQSQRDIARHLGQLVLDRHTIYLYADVLDSPDVCWENPEVDPLYKLVEQFLELSPRVELLNRRVEVVRELLSLLSDELKNKHASRLEEIIIYLIMIEIMLSLIKDIVPFAFEVISKQIAVRGTSTTAKLAATAVTTATMTVTSETILAITIITIIGVAIAGGMFAGLWIWFTAVQPIDKLKSFIRGQVLGGRSQGNRPQLPTKRGYDN